MEVPQRRSMWLKHQRAQMGATPYGIVVLTIREFLHHQK